ncbi:MAG: hypothetical protein KGY54_13780, partial [Oleiphilaceae bacterium]|nr:hypothetical protein [Oleiphilaceae bacterium]
MKQVLPFRKALNPARTFVRKILGQVRPVTDSQDFVLVGLRKGAAEHPEMLDELERRLSALD